MKNSEIVGFKEISSYHLSGIPSLPEPIGVAIRSGHLGHAILLESESDDRCFSMAVSLAGAMLCESSSGTMCHQCSQCHKIKTFNHSDLIICDPDTNKDIYSADSLSTLRISIYRKPVEAACKVVLLHHADKILPANQNSFLKIIEEPPANTYFIFTVPNRYLLLTTILSRVKSFSIPVLSDLECLKEIKAAAPGYSEDEYSKALIRCSGNPETAVSILTEPAIQKQFAAAEEVLAGLSIGDTYRSMAALVPFEKDRVSYRSVLRILSQLLSIDSIRSIYNLSPKVAAKFRSEIAPLLECCDRYAYLPLVSALLSQRCKR